MVKYFVFSCIDFTTVVSKTRPMSAVIHARVRLCFTISFHRFEFCIPSQSGQWSENIEEPRLGVLSRETSSAKWQKSGRLLL